MSRSHVFTIEVVTEAFTFKQEAIEAVSQAALKLKLASICRDGYLGYLDEGQAFVPPQKILGIRFLQSGTIENFTFAETPMSERIPVPDLAPPFEVAAEAPVIPGYKWGGHFGECI